MTISLRNRKIEKNVTRYSNNNRQLTGLIFLVTVLCTIIWEGLMVVEWMKDPHRLPLSKLVVTGERHFTTNEDIRQAILALGALGSFMTQDVNSIRQQIERMPWIKQVIIHKHWPNELKIHVVEYVPIACWNNLYLLDNSGKVFSAPAEIISNRNMPMLYGPEGSEQEVLIGYRTMSEVLIAADLKLKSVSMNDRYSWQLTICDGVRLELGRNDRIRRLQRFIRIYPILLQQARNDNKHIDYVDLRYDSGLAVGWG